MMIYEKDNVYYLKQAYRYFLADVTIKEHTVIITPTSEYVTSLDDANLVSYQELKNRFIKELS